MILHAVSNIVVICYNTMVSSELHTGCLAVLTKAQEKLLGISRKSPSPASSPPKASPTKSHNCSLFSPVLPTIDQPLIDEKLLNTSAISNTPNKSLLKSPCTPNRSMLSQSTMELLRWSHTNSPIQENSSFVMEESKISEILNNSSWHATACSDDEDAANDKSKASNHPDLSFYTNRSFLNSFDEKNSDASNAGKPKLDAWTAGTSFQIVDKEAIKKTISEQVYRVSTPPTSPQRLLNISQTKTIATEPDAKNTTTVSLDKFPLRSKFEKTEHLKAWLNHTIFAPLHKEICEINAIFKEKGLKSLEQMSFEHLSAVMSMGDGIGSLDAVALPLGRADGGDKSMELAHHRSNLEPYKAKLLRMMPYLEISQKTAIPLEAVINRIKDLASHSYLSSYNQETDADIITNCLTEFFNSRGTSDLTASSLKSKNWFSNRYVTGNLLITKETWVQNFGKMQDSTIKNLLQTMWSQKRANDRSAAGGDIDKSFDTSIGSGQLDKVVSVDNHARITDEVAPFLIKLKSSLLLVKDSKHIYEFSGSQAVFHTWLAFMQLAKQTDNDKKLAEILPV